MKAPSNCTHSPCATSSRATRRTITVPSKTSAPSSNPSTTATTSIPSPTDCPNFGKPLQTTPGDSTPFVPTPKRKSPSPQARPKDSPQHFAPCAIPAMASSSYNPFTKCIPTRPACLGCTANMSPCAKKAVAGHSTKTNGPPRQNARAHSSSTRHTTPRAKSSPNQNSPSSQTSVANTTYF